MLGVFAGVYICAMKLFSESKREPVLVQDFTAG